MKMVKLFLLICVLGLVIGCADKLKKQQLMERGFGEAMPEDQVFGLLDPDKPDFIRFAGPEDRDSLEVANRYRPVDLHAKYTHSWGSETRYITFEDIPVQATTTDNVVVSAVIQIKGYENKNGNDYLVKAFAKARSANLPADQTLLNDIVPCVRATFRKYVESLSNPALQELGFQVNFMSSYKKLECSTFVIKSVIAHSGMVDFSSPFHLDYPH